MKITRKAYAKINLGLDVTGKRADGYHIVRMIMQNVDLFDTLDFEDNETGEIVLTASSPKIPTDDSNLICIYGNAIFGDNMSENLSLSHHEFALFRI